MKQERDATVFDYQFYTLYYAVAHNKATITLTDKATKKEFVKDVHAPFCDSTSPNGFFLLYLGRLEACRTELVRQWCQYKKDRGDDKDILLHAILHA